MEIDMYRIAILGCENSHADSFLGFIKNDARFADVEVVGVYTDEPEAAKRISEGFGVFAADSYDAFVGKVDGIIVTARHGDNHLKYAAPYIPYGIPMFIDKPITCDEGEALKLVRELKRHGCKVTGGSCCKHAPLAHELAEVVSTSSHGKVYGGYLRAPISMTNNYGGFYFYSQHLAEVLLTIFGYNPKSVMVKINGNVLTVTVRYDSYDVVAEYVDGNYKYFAYVSCDEGMIGGEYPVSTPLFLTEFEEFYSILTGGEQKVSYEELIAPVNLITAMNRSIESGKEEAVAPIGEI